MGPVFLYMLAVSALSAAPDVILLSVDTLRADHLGCYGYPLNTSPALDRFAQESLLFEDCVCEVPLTNPSFSALLSSLYPRMTGTTKNGFGAAGHGTVQGRWISNLLRAEQLDVERPALRAGPRVRRLPG
jgi:arylsulfatase A-like enzyme